MNHAKPDCGMQLIEPETDTTQALAYALAEAADDRKAADIVLFKMGEVTYITDYFVIVTGFSRTQVKAIADAMEAHVLGRLNVRPLRKEGETDGSWIVLDYGDVIAHIMLPEQREFYNLEAFWGHAQRLDPTAAPQ
ncbi:ribosome silencing factor [Lyngbya confervoides]|uniref:Ribosomal silencing factor RsfS n=1 Tax=Lyngbya confervoides BDU141951 TaxID=1574623 RepID=A0ABD4T349_9CYAN|nr:ribosome silencing factor [Lyngbya confervoides]MCM1982662.1 ribosome silencing factor [Lyngbya confervoides BDU141951]